MKEDTKENTISVDPKGNSITENIKRTVSLRPLWSFSTLNGFLLIVFDRMGDRDNFSCKSFGLEKPCFQFYAASHSEI